MSLLVGGHDFTVMCRIVPGLPLIGDNVISGYATERTTSDQGRCPLAPHNRPISRSINQGFGPTER